MHVLTLDAHLTCNTLHPQDTNFTNATAVSDIHAHAHVESGPSLLATEATAVLSNTTSGHVSSAIDTAKDVLYTPTQQLHSRDAMQETDRHRQASSISGGSTFGDIRHDDQHPQGGAINRTSFCSKVSCKGSAATPKSRTTPFSSTAKSMQRFRVLEPLEMSTSEMQPPCAAVDEGSISGLDHSQLPRHQRSNDPARRTLSPSRVSFVSKHTALPSLGASATGRGISRCFGVVCWILGRLLVCIRHGRSRTDPRTRQEVSAAEPKILSFAGM